MEDIDPKEKCHDGKGGSHAVGCTHRHRHLYWSQKSLKCENCLSNLDKDMPRDKDSVRSPMLIHLSSTEDRCYWQTISG